VSRLTVSQRILIHLSLFSRFREEYECPVDVTQKGISSVLGVSRSHVALELKKLMEEEHVECRLAHVRGAKSRRKVYFPSFSGERMAASLRRQALEAEARWIDPDGVVREGSGEELLQLCRTLEAPMTPVYEGILSGEVVDLRVEAGPEVPEEAVGLVGRAREMERLREWYSRGTRVLLITGIPGVGKTTLARAFLREVEEAVWIKVYPFHSPSSLLASLARALASAGRGRLMAYLRSSPMDYAEAGILLSSEVSGMLLVFDDVGASPASDVLTLLLEYPAPGCRLLLTAREPPGFLRDGGLLEGGMEEMRLEGLSRDGARELVRSLRGQARDLEELYEATRGHPLLLKVLSTSSGPPVAEAEGLILDQVLEDLGPGEESVLLQASVYRQPVPREALSPGSLRDLRTLLRRGLLAENGGRYEVHDVLRPIVQRVAGEAMTQAHVQAHDFWRSRGEWLEAVHHLGAAGQYRELVGLAGHGLDEILEAGQAEELLEILEGVEDSVDDVLYLKARALDYLGRWTQALSVLEEGMGHATRTRRMALLLLRGRVLSKRGEFREAEEAFEAAAGLSEEEGCRLDLGKALYGLGVVLRKMGDMEAAVEHMRRALDIFEEEEAERDLGRARMEMGVIHLQAGQSDEAVEWFGRAMPLLSGRREDSAYLYNNLGIAYSRMAKSRKALEAFEESARLAEAVGLMRAQAYAMTNASDLYVDLGEVERAVEYCERSLGIFEQLRDPVMISACHANRAKAEKALGNLEEAERLYLESLRALEGTDAPYSLAARWLELSDLYEQMGDLERAHRFRSEALSVLKEERRSPPSREG
jgi:tetratricopeptide (TPR) repeat protein